MGFNSRKRRGLEELCHQRTRMQQEFQVKTIGIVVGNSFAKALLIILFWKSIRYRSANRTDEAKFQQIHTDFLEVLQYIYFSLPRTQKIFVPLDQGLNLWKGFRGKKSPPARSRALSELRVYSGKILEGDLSRQANMVGITLPFHNPYLNKEFCIMLPYINKRSSKFYEEK